MHFLGTVTQSILSQYLATSLSWTAFLCATKPLLEPRTSRLAVQCYTNTARHALTVMPLPFLQTVVPFLQNNASNYLLFLISVLSLKVKCIFNTAFPTFPNEEHRSFNTAFTIWPHQTQHARLQSQRTSASAVWHLSTRKEIWRLIKVSRPFKMSPELKFH